MNRYNDSQKTRKISKFQMASPRDNDPLTFQRLHQLLHYFPHTGYFMWIASATNGDYNFGDIAGTVNSHGYRIIGIDNLDYRSGRLAWFYMLGKWPEFEIDHIDGNRLNDMWDNLRDVTSKVNCENSIKYREKQSMRWKRQKMLRIAANEIIRNNIYDSEFTIKKSNLFN